MKIMIVDDHTAMRKTLRSIIDSSFQENEYGECSDGEEAVERFVDFHPDVVLMDIQLQRMNGFAAIEKIQKQDPHAKVIFVTSHDTALFRQKAQVLKARGFVSKENLSELTTVLQTITH